MSTTEVVIQSCYMNENMDEHFNWSTPVLTDLHAFGEWLTVAQSVAYCATHDLIRTPKTIGKWAKRSHKDPEAAELRVRKEDTINGFRYMIERASLEKKITEELEFERSRNDANPSTPEVTGLHPFTPAQEKNSSENITEPHDNMSTPKGTGVDMSTPPLETIQPIDKATTNTNRSEPVSTGEDRFTPERDAADPRDRYISHLEQQVKFYEEELIDRRKSSDALTNVIETFRLTAQSNVQKSLNATNTRENRSHPNSSKWGTGDNDDADLGYDNV